MLLNLTNHPSALWPENQKALAIAQYGNIEDMPFPQIDPQAKNEQLEKLIEEYEQKIIVLNPLAVHIMGELVFTFQLVQKLKTRGYLCLASTTARNTIEKDRIKTSVFEFVQFRNY